MLSGLAVSVFPESGLRPGMRVLSPADGFPELPGCRVGLIRNPHESLALADALAEHIISSLDNLSEAAQKRRSRRLGRARALPDAPVFEGRERACGRPHALQIQERIMP